MLEINYEIFDKVSLIEKYFEDDLSKKIFRMRVLANITNDIKHVHSMIGASDTYDVSRALEIYNKIDENYGIYEHLDVLSWIVSRNCDGNILLFGTGNASYSYRSLFSALGIAYKGYIDNNNYGFDIDGHHVYSVEENKELLKNNFIVITSTDYREEMTEQLIRLGVDEQRIFIPYDNALIAYGDNVYFDNSIWKPQEDLVFIDGGSYNLYSSALFAEWCKNSYKKIIAFEPDGDNYALCKKNIHKYNLDNIEIVNAGLSDRDGELHFEHSGDLGAGSFLSEQGEDVVHVRSLDEYLGGEPCSFIKLDIEGAEMSALVGAAETIKKYKPRLAICVYHKPEDIIDIPLYIKKIVPEYKFMLRHYSTFFYDTVLYAYID